MRGMAGQATGNAILAGDGMSRDCHESGMQAPVALARGVAGQMAAGWLWPKPRDQRPLPRCTVLALQEKAEGKVSPRRWERARTSKSATYSWAAEMMPAVHARRALQGCDCACWASTPAYEHSQIDRRQEAQQRRSLSPLSCACLAGSTVRGHPRLCARVFDCDVVVPTNRRGILSLSPFFFFFFGWFCCEQGLRLRHWTLG